MEAYKTCFEVLSQLGETIPQSFDAKESADMTETTTRMVKDYTETELLKMEDMNDKLSTTLKFYSLMTTVSFFAKPAMFSYMACKTVQLSIENKQLSKYSIMGEFFN